MTFEEKLDRARSGSRAAYEALCLGSIDKLYTAAVIALKDENTARSTVTAAINDGFAGISRIRDERHLRSWLVHELTKNAVDKLKALKADGVSHTAAGVFAETGKMPDVERLVFSVSSVFGYGTREISVLTGMAEETITEKLASAKKRLGAAYGDVCAAADSFEAPASLRERYTGFDESIARLEREEAEAAKPEPEPVLPAPEPEPVQPAPEPEPVQPAPEPELPEPPSVSEPEEAAEIQEPVLQNAPDGNTQEADETVFTDGEPEESEYTEEEYADEDDDYEYSEEESAEDDGDDIAFREPAPAKLNAETFIAVVTAEKMKGREFLRLIGNTRISNSAYREIEQNPKLTKKRLIELLEESPLTESDYYKLLTAVKDRREVLDAKEENRLVLERAGLYDGSRREKYRRKRREKPKTELELAIGLNKEKPPVQPLTFEENAVAEDDTDFQLQNSTGNFEHQKILSERRKNDQRQKDMDLGSIVNSVDRENEAVDPMSHASLHRIFNEQDYDPVDPFAAIGANNTGKQSKPVRKDERLDDWEAGPEKGLVSDSGLSLATTEFDAPVSVSDTRPFDLMSSDIQWGGEEQEGSGNEESPAPEPEEPGAAEEKPVPDEPLQFSEPEEEPVVPEEPVIPDTFEDDSEEDDIITTTPVQDGVSVTQIISEYAIGEAVSDEEAERASAYEPAYEPAEDTAPVREEPEDDSRPVGFAPTVDLVFDAASDAMDSDEPDDLSFSFDRTEDDDEPERPVRDKHASKHTGPAGPPPPAAHTVPDDPDDLPGIDEKDDIGGDDDEDPDGSGRKRYKGNEYFIDDNEYYEGVNRGKIITCAVLAVLLAAGSAGMKYLPLGNTSDEPVINDTSITAEVTEAPEVTEEKPAEEHTALPEEVTLSKLSSYEDIASGGYENAVTKTAAAGYLRASDKPFAIDVVYGGTTPGVLFTEDTAFVCSVQNGCTFRAVPIGEPEVFVNEDADTDTDTDDSVAEETAETAAEAPAVDEKLLCAYTSIDGDLYIVCGRSDTNGNILYETQVLVYGKNLSKKGEYAVSGSFTGAGIVDGKLVVAACGSPAEYTAAYNSGLSVSKHPYYTENGELHEISASDIYSIDGAKHDAINIIYAVGGGTPFAVLGGNAGYTRFGDYDMTLALPDGGITYGIDIAKDLQPVASKAYSGDAFSADCIGQGGMIGQTESGICAYKNGKTVSVPDETASAVAWSESGTAYVVTEHSGQRMLYGFDMSGDAPESAQITASDIYTDKLIKAGDGLVGLRAEPAPDGERAGLRISMYEYDGALKETAYSIIELDKDTPRDNLKYLSSPAETLPAFIGMNEDGTMFAVPTVYFDGYSEVERVVVLRWDGTLFSVCGEYIAYDEKSSVICAAIRGGRLFVVTDTKVSESEIDAG